MAQESLTLTGQFLVAKREDGTVYIERLNPTQDIFAPAQWAAAKESCEAKGMQFIGCVHCFQNNETGDLSAVANTDTHTPSVEETKWMQEAMLEIKYSDLFVANLQDSRVQQMLAEYPLQCKDCLEGKELNLV